MRSNLRNIAVWYAGPRQEVMGLGISAAKMGSRVKQGLLSHAEDLRRSMNTGERF